MILIALILVFAAGSSPVENRPSPTEVPETVAEIAISRALDDFHQAAAVADEARYFAHFAPDGVFLGTDPSERWTVEAFRAYAHPHFAAGKGWKYSSFQRHIAVTDDLAWFDELLHSDKYGACRGTGVLKRIGGKWLVEQYSLTFLVPNALAKQVTEEIQRAGK